MAYPALDPEYLEAVGPPEVVRPYVGLWASVMQRAVDDAQGRVLALHLSGFDRKSISSDMARENAKRRVVGDATAWFASDEHYIGSFVWICALLKLDPGAVRARVLGGA